VLAVDCFSVQKVRFVSHLCGASISGQQCQIAAINNDECKDFMGSEGINSNDSAAIRCKPLILHRLYRFLIRAPRVRKLK
jgi:hypothetical protein